MTEPSTPAPKRTRRRAERAAAAEPLAAAELEAAAEAASIVAAMPSAPMENATAAPPTELSSLVEAVQGRDLDVVAVSRLQVERGGIGEATADTVELRMGGIGRLDAEDVFVQFGGVGAARADVLNVEWGGVGPAAAGELRVTQGVVGNVIAREATIDQGFVRMLIAGHVTVTRPSAALVVLAARVDGEVRALVDWRGALAFGLGFGVLAAVSRGLRKRR